jgi:hypothetical protein
MSTKLGSRKVLRQITMPSDKGSVVFPSGEPVTVHLMGPYAWIISLATSGLRLKVTQEYISDLENGGFLSKIAS